MQPRTQFAYVEDFRVAYQVLGEGPVDLVVTLGSFNNVDFWWDDPSAAHFLRSLAQFSRLIVFDRRGSGASDPFLGDLPTLDHWKDDLEAVLDAAGSRRTAIFAAVDGALLAIPFAATSPQRVSHLILYNSSARVSQADGYPIGHDQATATFLADFLASTWGKEEGVAAAYPGRDVSPDFARWYARFQRSAMSRAAVLAYLPELLMSDLRPYLTHIQAPTMVLHREQLATYPASHGRYLAENIEGASFVELPGHGVIIGVDDLDAVVAHVERHLGGAPGFGTVSHRFLSTVLFTDVIASTERAASVGDHRWKDLLRTHEEVTQRHVQSFGGEVIKSTGDGVLAIFGSPGRAVTCATALSNTLREQGMPVRAGLHTGEVDRKEDGDIGGLAVHLAARVLGAAQDSEVLVSSTVRDLVVGGNVTFEDRGTRALRGIPGEWHLWAARSATL